MSPASASELRVEATTRLSEIAGYDTRLNIALTLSRPHALDVLYRQALHAAAGNPPLITEIRQLHKIATGRAWDLDDAIHAHGLPDAANLTTPEPITLTETDYATAIQEIFG